MKRLIIGCCLLMLMVSCGGGKKKADPFSALTEQIDSIKVHPDSIQDSTVVVEEQVPAAADESFADFFYNFASDEAFQRTRVVFPFSLYKGKQVTRIQKEDWKFDPLFSREPAYTVLFDKEEDMEIEKDTSLHSVQVDWIFLTDRRIKRYYFQRKKDSWFLEAINVEKLPDEEDGKEDFYAFYERFSRDSLFQQERLHDPLKFVTADPEDEFQILETTLEQGQWFAFRPPMMKGRMTNVHYGQPENIHSDYKVVEFKGFGNGFSNTLYFERYGGEWKLMRFEDLSD
ncbi:MAG TPA: DUF4348 domain-containing protein [Bacteroides mediterraneensis]|uniref:DUF4348 domain-containing protein n=1 Tax=Bacteroides mediterraneensis TaxID=1841856 RepID=UPI00260ED8B8|nr:DUF4348 domain-containing protein [Bacteroides mediterraneensis]HJH63324.1 DUF4348 domain-containing protein [Bacteroides mediterraneensis]